MISGHTKRLEFVVRGAPRGKQAMAAGRSGHVYMQPMTREHMAYLRLAASEAMEAQGLSLFTGALLLVLRLDMPLPKSWPDYAKQAALEGLIRPTVKPDHDNCAKMLDALNQVVWVDDSHIVSSRIDMYYSESPSTKVIIEEIGAAWPWTKEQTANYKETLRKRLS